MIVEKVCKLFVEAECPEDETEEYIKDKLDSEIL